MPIFIVLSPIEGDHLSCALRSPSLPFVPRKSRDRSTCRLIRVSFLLSLYYLLSRAKQIDGKRKRDIANCHASSSDASEVRCWRPFFRTRETLGSEFQVTSELFICISYDIRDAVLVTHIQLQDSY